MMEQSDKLSAYLDGELSADEARDIEAALEHDPALQAELESLMAVDVAVRDVFADVVEEPIPFELAAAIQSAPDAVAETVKSSTAPAEAPHVAMDHWSNRSPWLAVAASLALLMVGGATGYMAGGSSKSVQVVAASGWLGDIADYHRVYAGQERHLVEVDASEADHIETWLSASIGAQVRVPDLSEQGLAFQGGRLLVAAGKPVSQLIFKDAQGRVVALCQIGSEAPRDGQAESQIGDFKLVTWGGADANFVVIGDADNAELRSIAEATRDAA